VVATNQKLSGSTDRMLSVLCVQNAIVAAVVQTGAGPLEVPVRLLERDGDRLLIDQPCVCGEPVDVVLGAPIVIVIRDHGRTRIWTARAAGRIGFQMSTLSGLALDQVRPHRKPAMRRGRPRLVG
jgi:hypothetical protein